ncbi:SpoIIE family protein phosphatase [Streptomyces sp. KLMMK]
MARRVLLRPVPPRLVAHLQNATYWDMAEPVDDRTTGEGFITAAVLDVPDDRPVLRLINCGHPPPLVLSDGEVTTLAVSPPGRKPTRTASSSSSTATCSRTREAR